MAPPAHSAQGACASERHATLESQLAVSVARKPERLLRADSADIDEPGTLKTSQRERRSLLRRRGVKQPTTHQLVCHRTGAARRRFENRQHDRTQRDFHRSTIRRRPSRPPWTPLTSRSPLLLSPGLGSLAGDADRTTLPASARFWIRVRLSRKSGTPCGLRSGRGCEVPPSAAVRRPRWRAGGGAA